MVEHFGFYVFFKTFFDFTYIIVWQAQRALLQLRYCDGKLPPINV